MTGPAAAAGKHGRSRAAPHKPARRAGRGARGAAPRLLVASLVVARRGVAVVLWLVPVVVLSSLVPSLLILVQILAGVLIIVAVVRAA